MEEKMKPIQILECTLRDGGLGLEDAYMNDMSKSSFERSDIDRIVFLLSSSRVDIIELGSIEISKEDKSSFGIYQNIEAVSALMPLGRDDNQMYVALFRGPDTPVEDIPNWRPGLVEGLRVIIRYSELTKSIEFCAALAKKGYKVFVQPMLTMRYTEEELDYIIDAANQMNAYAVYFVDSYGYMHQDDVKRLFIFYDGKLKKEIKIGFHAHNNMNLAFSNAIFFTKLTNNRNIIIDSCILGMGQGSGNLQTELITNYLNKSYGYDYCFDEILDVCEIIEKYLTNNIWGYSVVRLLPAIHRTAYKYAVHFRYKNGLSYKEIHDILQNVPDELRHRYTKQNAATLLENWEKQRKKVADSETEE